jgi:hypothetical protein
MKLYRAKREQSCRSGSTNCGDSGLHKTTDRHNESNTWIIPPVDNRHLSQRQKGRPETARVARHRSDRRRFVCWFAEATEKSEAANPTLGHGRGKSKGTHRNAAVVPPLTDKWVASQRNLIQAAGGGDKLSRIEIHDFPRVLRQGCHRAVFFGRGVGGMGHPTWAGLRVSNRKCVEVTKQLAGAAE